MPAKPTSQKEKKLKGDTTHRKETKDFVKVDSCEPDMPDFLEGNEVAINEWRRLVPLLVKAKVLTQLDGVTLGMLCAAYANMASCLEVISKKGATIKTGSNGYVQQRPEVSIYEKTYKQYLKLCAEFGMTPRARSAMRINTGGSAGGGTANSGQTDKESKFKRFFGQDRSTLAR